MVHDELRRGKLTVGYGPMFSGKTSWLIREYGDGTGAIAFKPDIDKRYTARAVLSSHNHKESPAIMLSLSELSVIVNEAVRAKKKGMLTKILIDESNFFPDTIIDIIEDVLSRGIDVLVAGLMTDSERADFGPTRKLSQMADQTLSFSALCDFVGCKKPADFTYAKKKKETQLVVGAADMYGASCALHYDKLHVNEKKKTIKFAKLRSYGVYPGFISWLEHMDLPFMRVPRVQQGLFPHIEVGGDSMRVGKTTALKVLSEQLALRGAKVQLSLEDWQHNPYVKASYGDSSEVITNSQIWFARRKFEQLSRIDDTKAFIQDVHPEMDYCYALANVLMGRMSLKQFEQYVSAYFELSWSDIPAPDLLIYLKVSDQKLIERAQRAAREFESIDPNYFFIMKTVNRKWLAEAKKRYHVLEIDTDDFDFSQEASAQEKLGKLVSSKLTHSGWDFNSVVRSNWPGLLGGSWDEIFSKRLVILSGLPGSGKSFWAHRLKKEQGYSYLSSDVVRTSATYVRKSNQMDIAHDEVALRDLAYVMLHETLLKRLKEGKKVVVDATYLGPQRDLLLSLLKKRGLLSQTVFLVVKSNSVVKENNETYAWFSRRLATGEIRYPDEALDGVRVIEVWNK